MKTCGHQHMAYAFTDVYKAYSAVTKYAFRNCTSKCGVAKSCPGTHTTLQVPMDLQPDWVRLKELSGQ